MANRGQKFPPEVFRSEEIDKFFSTFTHSFTGTRNRCMFLLALRAQLRSFEITSLHVDDVNLDAGSILVRQGKGGKRRVVGMGTQTARELEAWVAARSKECVHFFHTFKGRPIDPSYLRKVAARHGKDALKNRRVHVHAFRHTGAFMLAEKGVEIRVIQKQLGHSNLAITTRYLDHLGAGEVVERVNAISWD